MAPSNHLFVTLLVLLSSAALSAAVSTTIVINEVDYDQPGTDATEFIELKNVGASNIDLTGWNLQLVNGAVTTNPVVYTTVALAPVTLAPGAYHVICPAGATPTVANCNQQFAIATNAIQNGPNDAVRLVNPSGTTIDQLSYGGPLTGYSEGSVGAPSDDPNAVVASSISRCPDGVDTDDNAADFKLVAVSPGTANTCTGTPATTPAPTGTGNPSATPTSTPTATGTTAPTPTGTSGSCNIAGETPIYTINGNGAAPTMIGSKVIVRGVLTGAFDGTNQLAGFYIQTPDAQADADVTTSNGIFVYFAATRANFPATAVGDIVQVAGTVANFNGLPEITTITALSICSRGNALPVIPQITLSATAQNLRQYLNMLVSFPQPLTVTDNYNDDYYGEIKLSVNGRRYVPTQLVAPGAPAMALEAQNNAQTILIDDGDSRTGATTPLNPIPYPAPGLSDSNTIRTGYTLTSPLIGDLSYGSSFGFLLEPTTPPPSGLTFSATSNPRPTAPPAVGGRLKVVGMNLENFFTQLLGQNGCSSSDCRGATTAQQYQTQLSKEVLAIAALNADVYAFQELQNNGFGSGSSIYAITTAVNAKVGAGTYDYIRVNTGDGGNPSIISTDPNCNVKCVGGDAITVGMMYRVSAVTPVGVARAITKNVDPDFPSDNTRPSVAQTFADSTGAKFTVVANHLKSKGSACTAAGDPDTGDGQGNCNLTRKRAAQAIIRWLATDPTGSQDPDFVLLGDMNAYAMEDPIKAFEAGGFVNLLRLLIGDTAYSYVFNGETGYLDHALASPSLVSQVSGIGEFHINADEPIALHYDNKANLANPNSFYRTSDHDPLIMGLNLVQNTGPVSAPAPAPGTPTPTPTATATPTPTPTAKAPAPAPATATPTPTPTATATPTPTPTATATPTPTPTAKAPAPATGTPTPTPTATATATPTPTPTATAKGPTAAPVATVPVPCPSATPAPTFPTGGVCDYAGPTPNQCFNSAGSRYICCATACPNSPGVDPVCSGTPAPTPTGCFATVTPSPTGPTSTPAATTPGSTPAATTPGSTPAATTPGSTTAPQVLPVGGTCDPYGPTPNQCFAANGQTYVCCQAACPTGAPGAVPRCA